RHGGPSTTKRRNEGRGMAELIKQQHALNVLRMTMDRGSEAAPPSSRDDESPAQVVFELEIAGDRLARIEAKAASFGLPQTIAAARQMPRDPDFRIPEDVIGAIRRGLATPNALTPPLWLELARPRGTLALAPWERLLAPLGVPVLRLPYFAVRPVTAPDPIDVLVCASSPEAKTPFPAHELIKQFV